ncbi:hypothetical protein COCNU_08G011940 [Cocos nucifera]|uniref:Uncharacterized protein n=1 Tax=Cocos nucifera TaxID=13894 RepID=A0A8K0IIL4_COCNU|nr:hypothetical protein COCNU_08G011940 [Cocos nucifera]
MTPWLKEQEKDAAAQEKNLSNEVSHLRVKLGSIRSKLESVQSDLKSAQVEVRAQKSRIKKKKHVENKLEKDRNNWAKEAEDLRQMWQIVDEKLSSTRAEIQALQRDLGRVKELAIEEFKTSSDLKILILQESEASY